MTETQTSTVRPALERLARKWTLTLPSGALTRSHFFGEALSKLLAGTADAELPATAADLADNWGNAGTGVPEGLGTVRGDFAFDVKQALKAAAA